MNEYAFSLLGQTLHARADGTLWWPDERILVVSDLHLGKSERMARRGGELLPPYESQETLIRLDQAISLTKPSCVICLGDSFDDVAAADALADDDALWIARMQSGLNWIWITGNHDPAPGNLAGQHKAQHRAGGLVFRHIAVPQEMGEISGHYHPKMRVSARGRSLSRPAFLIDDRRVIMPAFGVYTGGLSANNPALTGLIATENGVAVLTGTAAYPVPLRCPA